jgi:protein-L-isoaspartate(D-aspartate) O-methyltransferase
MVDTQLAARGIRDRRVLGAMRRVPRERFVPPAVNDHAYADRALPIGAGQTISQPYIVAAMTEALGLARGDRVLEVGTGSGYQAAILAELANEVITIERRADLADEARERLRALGYQNVTVIVGDGSLGYAERAPYDAVLVAAAAPRVPDALRAQLAHGGRLIIPVGPHGQQVLTLVRRNGDDFHESARDGCIFVPLIGAGGFPESSSG